MSDVRRGRPAGSSPTQATDDVFLREVAHRIHFVGADTPTEMFDEISKREQAAERLDTNQGAALVRRLQRRWQRDSAGFLKECQEQKLDFWKQRWEFEAKTLKSESPELFTLLEKFGASPEGQKILAGYGLPGDPAAMLSLGIVKLWELIRQSSPLGAVAAEQAFAPTCSIWSRFGIEPDSSFLTRMGELCLAKAAELESGGAASPNETGKDPTR